MRSSTCSVGSPAGSIIHTARGAGSPAASASSVSTVRIRGSAASALRAPAALSHAITSRPARAIRRLMFPPMRPSPIMPNIVVTGVPFVV